MDYTPALSYLTQDSIGRIKAKDFPDPVSASEIMSCPLKRIGIDCIYMGVGMRNLNCWCILCLIESSIDSKLSICSKLVKGTGASPSTSILKTLLSQVTNSVR